MIILGKAFAIWQIDDNGDDGDEAEVYNHRHHHHCNDHHQFVIIKYGIKVFDILNLEIIFQLNEKTKEVIKAKSNYGRIEEDHSINAFDI